ncbi:MAG TPA: doxX family protein [Candidatus Gracilibacteria bacterium]
MKGSAFTKLGLALLFLWGGLEKLFTGFLGGVGLKAVAGMLGGMGFGFLGETGTYVLAIVLAVVELAAGLIFLGAAFGCKKCGSCCYVKKAAWAGVIIMVGAIALVHIPSFDAASAGSWANLLLHVVVVTTCLGIATGDKKCEVKV